MLHIFAQNPEVLCIALCLGKIFFSRNQFKHTKGLWCAGRLFFSKRLRCELCYELCADTLYKLLNTSIYMTRALFLGFLNK